MTTSPSAHLVMLAFALLGVLSVACKNEHSEGARRSVHHSSSSAPKENASEDNALEPDASVAREPVTVNAASNCPSIDAEGSGDVLFKVVMFGYTGVVDAAERFYGSLPAEQRIDWLLVPENDGWKLSSAKFRLPPGKMVRGRRVSIQLWAHEGIGFIGQPGSAKDIVFKGASGIIAVASAKDVEHLAGVFEAEITRVYSKGARPGAVFCAPSTAGSLDLKNALAAAKASDAVSLIVTAHADCLAHPAVAIDAIARHIEKNCQ